MSGKISMWSTCSKIIMSWCPHTTRFQTNNIAVLEGNLSLKPSSKHVKNLSMCKSIHQKGNEGSFYYKQSKESYKVNGL